MPRESKFTAAARARVSIITPILRATYPHAVCSLDFATPLQLVVATILSAQCTDKRVNLVTPALFAKCKDAAAFAAASQEALEKDIQQTGFYRNKAKSIRSMAQALIDHHAGEVPQTMEELTALAGIGRKTANVVLGNAFGINLGIAVDTHVTRLANRLALTKHKSDAVKIEHDLMPIVPQSDWTEFSHLLIYHGRNICLARNPQCPSCPLLTHCPTGLKIVTAQPASLLADLSGDP